MGENSPYSGDEIRQLGDTMPTRGPKCPKCSLVIPQFADLPPFMEARLRQLSRSDHKIMALKELREATDCPLSWAKLWVDHGGGPPWPVDRQPEPTPCPFCGKALRTARAKQCRFCGKDWH